MSDATQPPAAPETDVSAEVVLTPEEREELVYAVGNHCSHTGRPDYSLPNWCRDCDRAVAKDVAPAVERIVAEHVWLVEGERDAARALLDRHGMRYCLCSRADRMNNRVQPHCPHHGTSRYWAARTESAEAAHAALVAAVEALADEYATAVRSFESEGPPTNESRFARNVVTELRALAGGDR